MDYSVTLKTAFPLWEPSTCYQGNALTKHIRGKTKIQL
jgi:hypothetical protein